MESRQQFFDWSPYFGAVNHPEWDLSLDDQRVLALGPPQDAEGRYIVVQNFFEGLRQRTGN